MRALAPAESLIYLETQDLGEMLEALTQNKTFRENAKIKPDFSALKNAQTAIIVTGFESAEKRLSDESSILNFKPQFALIADTHSWERTNIALVENQVAGFVSTVYGGNAKLEKSRKQEAHFYVWTAEDNRKFYAAVEGSLIYLGNNESAIDKCLSVKRGAGENLLQNESLAQARKRGSGENLAFGYISAAGVNEMANLLGVSVAVDAAEEDLTKSFIAKIVPLILQKTVREVSWMTRKTEQGIEDKIYIKTDEQISNIWKETLVTNASNQFQIAEFIPANAVSVTRYNLQNPQIAWRSVLITLSGKLENFDGKIWFAASNSFFAPFGIADAEAFLSAISPNIATVRLNSEGAEPLAIAEVKDEAKLKSALIKDFNFNVAPEKIGDAAIWKTADGDSLAVFVEGKVLLGSRNNILLCLKARENGQNFAGNPYYQALAQTNALTVTFAKDNETAGKVVSVLGNGSKINVPAGFYTTETRYNSYGFERRTVSAFGLLGTLVSQFEEVE